MAVAQYSVVVELVAAGTALRLGLGRPCPCATARATTRHNRVNRLSPVVSLMPFVVFVETVATVLLGTEVMGLWRVIAVASMVQGVSEARLASHLGLVPLPYRHWKYTRSLSFLLAIVLWVSLRSHPLIPKTLKTWHS